MTAAYERYEDIEASDAENSSQSEDENESSATNSGVLSRHRSNMRYQALFGDKWPKKIGISQIVMGSVTVLTAFAQLFVLPLVYDTSGSLYIGKMAKSNCYGVGLWAGMLLVITGIVGTRAAVFKSISSMYLYFTLVLLNCAVYTGAVLLVLIGYSEKWTTPDAYSDGGVEFGLHLGVSFLVAIGYMFVITSFIQYYEDVFCGDLQLCKRSVHCCFPCCCPRAISQEELLAADEYERPPNLPV